MKRFLTIAALSLVALSTAACSEFPAYRQMQAEAAAKARITQLTAEGQAQLAKAKSARQVIALNAQMRLEAASADAQREVVRAEGLAKANKIIADSLGGPDGYLRWKYIEMLEDNKTATTIYIPTEGGLPILAGGKK